MKTECTGKYDTFQPLATKETVAGFTTKACVTTMAIAVGRTRINDKGDSFMRTKKMAPRDGLEPPTGWLTATCSTD